MARKSSKPVVKNRKRKLMSKSNGKANTGKKKSSYNDTELTMFKDLIMKKIDTAKQEFQYLQEQITMVNDHGTSDTAATFKVLEDGASAMEKEQLNQMAVRQQKFIRNLEDALVRIKNKTYGICRVTGSLIPKERLLAVPHTTLSMDAKLKQYN